MNINIEAYKPNKTIEVQAQSINSTTDLRNAIYIQTNEKTNEDRYLQEKEFKLRQEFNDFIYDYYGKRGCKLDPYIKNKLWETFKFEKKREEKSIFNYLSNLWESFEDKYFL